jgi:amidohydrolase
MTVMAAKSLSSLLSSLPDLASYESLYKHFHAHPELSQQEHETAKTVARQLRDLQVYDVHTGIGGTGLVGVLKNGSGKTILLRADMDALPVKEDTGLEYASTLTVKDESDGLVKSVMHACGHDMHMTCLLAAADFLANIRDHWKGTLIVLFQPNEERGGGANAMVKDGLYNIVPVPDCVLGQHVMAMRAGNIGSRPGTIMTASNRFKITLFGRGGHGSMPHVSIHRASVASFA